MSNTSIPTKPTSVTSYKALVAFGTAALLALYPVAATKLAAYGVVVPSLDVATAQEVVLALISIGLVFYHYGARAGVQAIETVLSDAASKALQDAVNQSVSRQLATVRTSITELDGKVNRITSTVVSNGALASQTASNVAVAKMAVDKLAAAVDDHAKVVDNHTGAVKSVLADALAAAQKGAQKASSRAPKLAR